MTKDLKNGKAAFVMAHWRDENVKSRKFFDEAIDSILKQTDQNFHIVIVDDNSPNEEVIHYLRMTEKKYPDKISVIYKDKNEGAGPARNAGIRWAFSNGLPLVLFNDSDDNSHPRRLEVARKHFNENPETTVVYSTFLVIDEKGNKVPEVQLGDDIREILDGHKKNIVQGENAWLAIGTEKNYTTLTSSTAVRTDVAMTHLFPEVKAAEDANTWYRYGAHKGIFVYCPEIPTFYRIASKKSSNARDMFGDFYEFKAKIDTEGFKEAMEIAIKNGSIQLSEAEKRNVMVRFHIKLAETLSKSSNFKLASEQVKHAVDLSKVMAINDLNSRNLSTESWVLAAIKD